MTNNHQPAARLRVVVEHTADAGPPAAQAVLTFLLERRARRRQTGLGLWAAEAAGG